MKQARSLLFAIACAAWAATSALAEDRAACDAILGKWWFPKRNGQMEIRCDKDVYSAKVIAYDKKDALDKNNPDPALRERPFVGVEMLKDFKYDAKKQTWAGGTIYDGDSGKTYKCALWFKDGDTSRLNARGYVGISVLGRTEVFARVTESEEKAKEEEAKGDEKKPGQ